MADEPQGKNILIVDDEAGLGMVFKEVMSAHGFRVQTAVRWDHALAKIGADKPDLVVLDLMIPETSPFDMLRDLQQGKLADIPVIAISGRYGDPEFVAKIRKEPNVRDFFKKPFAYVDLAMRIHEILGTKSSAK